MIRPSTPEPFQCGGHLTERMADLVAAGERMPTRSESLDAFITVAAKNSYADRLADQARYFAEMAARLAADAAEMAALVAAVREARSSHRDTTKKQEVEA